jgi:hypothetical protein
MVPVVSLRLTLRIFLKAAALLVCANFLCLWAKIDPVIALMNLNAWWLVGHGRPRLIYPNESNTDGVLPIDATIQAHAIAYTSHSDSTFRVAVIGDSAIMGQGLTDDETFTAQLNMRNFKIKGKRVVSYNLGYPGPNAAVQVLIMRFVLRYQPDLILWFVNPFTISDTTDSEQYNLLYRVNRLPLTQLVDDYPRDLGVWGSHHLAPLPFPRNLLAIQDTSLLRTWFISLSYPFRAPNVPKIDDRRITMPLPDQAYMYIGADGFAHLPTDAWAFFDVGESIAGQAHLPLLLINEPIFIGQGRNSDRLYDQSFARTTYDHYRLLLAHYTQDRHFWYDDIWNLVPPVYFTDTDLHLDSEGYSLVVDHVIAVLGNASLPTY